MIFGTAQQRWESAAAKSNLWTSLLQLEDEDGAHLSDSRVGADMDVDVTRSAS